MKYNVLIFLINIIVVNCGIYNYFNPKVFNYNEKNNEKYIKKYNIENFIFIKNKIFDNKILDNKIIKYIIDYETRIISNASNINILDIALLF